MQRKYIDEIKEGEINAIDVFDVTGKILLKKGTEIKSFNLEKLKLYGIPIIYVENNEIFVNYIYDMNLRAELIKILKCFFESEGENSVILKKYNMDEIRKFLAYNNEKGNQIAYGHIFKYFINEMLICLKNNSRHFYDFVDYRSLENYYFYHSINVACISLLLGYKMNLKNEELIDLGVGALLYDLKMQLYKFVEQNKSLTEIEKEEMQQHTYLSFDAIRKIYGITARAASIAYQHHERFDGSGYPQKLKGEQINLLSKIVAVADVYDALTANRSHRKAYLPEEAYNYIKINSGVLFDPEVVFIFEKSIAKFLPGDIVLLNEGSKAIVLYNNKEDMESPVIKIIEKKSTDDIIPDKIDLLKEKKFKIIKTINSVR